SRARSRTFPVSLVLIDGAEPRGLSMRIAALVAAIAAFLLITPGAGAAGPPTVNTGGANAVTQTTVTLNGTIKPNGQDTTWHFEYGTTTSYGTSTPEQGPVAAGAGSQSVTFQVSGLTPGSLYHYRLVGTNASGSIPGKDRTFTTRPAVSIGVNRGTVSYGQPVTVSGRVFGTTVSGITVSLQENPYPFAGFGDV